MIKPKQFDPVGNLVLVPCMCNKFIQEFRPEVKGIKFKRSKYNIRRYN
jgi:hypothetical protein